MVGLFPSGRAAGRMTRRGRDPDEAMFANRTDPETGEPYPADMPNAGAPVRGDMAMERGSGMPGTRDDMPNAGSPLGREKLETRRGLMGPADDDRQDTGDAPNVSPEEQRQYDAFVGNGIRLIFDERTAPTLLNRLKATQNPIEGLASTTVMVVDRLKDSAERSGAKLSPDVLMHGGIELMENIAELSRAANLHEYTPEEIENAMYAALDMYGTQELQRGTIDKNAIAQDFQALVEADRQGRLEEVLPGISAKAEEIQRRGRGAEEV